MPRPRGYVVSPVERERISASQTRRYDKQKPWLEIGSSIREVGGDLSDKEIEQIRLALLREVRALVAQTKKARRTNRPKARKAKTVDEYSGIPRMTERARRSTAARNKLQGEPMGDDGAAYIPHRRNGRPRPAYRNVRTTEARHAPMTGTHSHAHAAFDDPVEHNGFHSHEHEHFGDADHDHHDED